MKECPKCLIAHEKTGLYCSRKCANSRTFSNESKKKKSLANKKFYESMTETERINYNFSKISLYDRVALQIKATETKRKKTWSKPYEEMGRDSLRKRLLIECNYTCQECGQTSTHNNKYLPLEMDHINGNPKDNSRKNLRILCPNCHSQTPTYRAKNIKTNRPLDIEQLTELLIKYKFATPALRELGFANSPHKMRIANEILEKLKEQKLI